MTTSRPRQVWQHDIENISEDQIKECLHRLKWNVDKFGKDYGEDLFVRIFENGTFIGKAFYAQLKGSTNPQQYALKAGGFSYAVDTVNLLQWYNNQFPVIFVLWDIDQRVGYWLHIQPYVDKKLKSDSNWLKKEDGTRKIHIPPDQILHADTYQSLLDLITQEYKKISLGLQILEHLQISELDATAHQLIDKFRLVYKPSDTQLDEAASISEEELTFIPQEIALSSTPDNAKGWMQLAMRYYTQHDYAKAMASINKAKNLGASGTQYAMVHGSILTEYFIAQGSRRKSLLHEAIALFEIAREGMQSTEKAYADYNIGNTLSQLGNYAEAIQRFDAALSVRPDNHLVAQIWKNRGTAYFHLRNHEEEFASYKKALDVNPNLWQAYTSWAITETYLENYAHAKELYLLALKAYPTLIEQYPGQIYGLALAYWKLEELSLSYEYVNQILSVKPDYEAALGLKRQLMSSLWRKDKQYTSDALKFFQMWIQDDPGDMFVSRELYLLYRSQSDQQQASKILNNTTPHTTASPEDLYQYALMLIDEEKISEAITILERAFQQNQGHAIVHKLAQLKQRTADYDGAIHLYKLLFADDELQLLQNVADSFHSLKDHEVCVWCCTRAILLDPKKESWWNNLVYSLMALSKVSSAVSVEQLRVDLMSVLLENPPSRPPSEFAQLLQEIIKNEFDDTFIESIITPVFPF